MTTLPLLDADELLGRIAAHMPADLRDNVAVIGSIATAWAFRDISGSATVATKDIDLLLQPHATAISTAEALADQLLDRGWRPTYPTSRMPGTAQTPDADLPALRLAPPNDREGWYLELMGAPHSGQLERRRWRRFATGLGHFALPCFRFMPVAIHAAEPTDFEIRAALPAQMALAHLLEHSDPDVTPIANLPGNPPRFVKDVGRAVSLWWLADEQFSAADEQWLIQWRQSLVSLYPDLQGIRKQEAAQGLAALRGHQREAHAIAVRGVLAAHGTTLEAWDRAYVSLTDLIEEL